MWSSGQNVVYNDSDIHSKEFHFVVNGKGRTQFKRRQLDFLGIRCYDPCLPPVVVLPIEPNYRLWSDPASWTTTGKVPEAGENAEVEPGWNMLFDV